MSVGTHPTARRTGRGEKALRVYTWLILAWLTLPIATMIAFSFNDRVGKRNNTWNGFTVKRTGKHDLPAGG